MFLNMSLVDDILRRALYEDIGTGDITTLSTVDADSVTTAYIHAKEKGVVAGLPVAQRVFQLLDSTIEVVEKLSDGDWVQPGDILAVLKGSARSILTGERLALNILQRLSGIATQTAQIAKKISPYDTVVVDTRKTTPGIRILEKYAVRVGGGQNHRFGLYDGVLIKDNHIKVAGGIREAVKLAKRNIPHTIKIEVEVEDVDGVKEALEANADIIMLDNMQLSEIKEAVKLINGRALVEVSGGITEQTVLEYAKAGVDIISVGALTHSVKSLDISLDVGQIKKL